MTTDDALQRLLADLKAQYARRAQMYADAGGTKRLQGSLTAYLEYRLLQAVFPEVERRKK